MDDGGGKTLFDLLREVLCPGTEIAKLGPEKLQGLHLFKEEVGADLEQLYQKMPPKEADPFLVSIMQRLIDEYRKA